MNKLYIFILEVTDIIIIIIYLRLSELKSGRC